MQKKMFMIINLSFKLWLKDFLTDKPCQKLNLDGSFHIDQIDFYWFYK